MINTFKRHKSKTVLIIKVAQNSYEMNLNSILNFTSMFLKNFAAFHLNYFLKYKQQYFVLKQIFSTNKPFPIEFYFKLKIFRMETEVAF